MPDPRPVFLPLEKHLPALAGRGWRASLRNALEILLGIRSCRLLLAKLEPMLECGKSVFDAFLDLCEVKLDAAGVAAAIPATGPLVIIANHPFGGMDGLAVAALATRSRPDVRFLVNAELLALPGAGDYLLALEILGEDGAPRRNSASLKQAVRHLRNAGVLVVFPAGAVAHWQWRTARVEDPPWPLHAARIVRRARAPVLPIRVFGRNGPLFQILGACHPMLRTALICRAFLAMRGHTIACRAGPLLPFAALPENPAALSTALRHAVESVPPNSGN